MKITYVLLYWLSAMMFFVALLGSSLTQSFFNPLSEKIIEHSGLKKNYIQSIDNKIDELVYKSKQIELQIEKIKNFFTSEKTDESKYQKERSEMLERNVYQPLVNLMNNMFRAVLGFLSVMILLFAIIFHLLYRSIDLRKRLNRLESIVLKENFN